MERVATLIEKLRELSQSGANPEKLMTITQLLQAELQKNIAATTTPLQSKISVIMPVSVRLPRLALKEDEFSEPSAEMVTTVPEPHPLEEKIIEVLQVNEEDIEEELREIKRNAESRNQMSAHTPVNDHHEMDHMDDIPTLSQQRYHNEELPREINESGPTEEASLNDRLKESRIELSEKLTDSPIRDLRKAIDINDRFLYINELFRGDEAMYERSIKTINNFSILPEAEYWIQRELKVKIGWSDKNEVVRQFDQLVRRRFS